MTADDVGRVRELKMLAARHDVVGVVVHDPAEHALPPGRGTLRLRDVESGRAIRIGLSDRLRERYRESTDARRRALREAFYRVPADSVFVRSDESAVEPLLRLFMSRKLV